MQHFRTCLAILNILFFSSLLAQSGALDLSFSGDGHLATSIVGPKDNALGVAVLPDGKIIVCGTEESYQNNHMLVARFTAIGLLDTSFSNDGRLSVPIGFTTNNTGTTVVIQPDDKILVAGSESTTDGRRMTVVRLEPDGALDGTFGANGRTTIPMDGQTTEALCMVLLADGSIVMGGTKVDFFNYALMARVDGSGEVDTAFTNAANATLSAVSAIYVNSIAVLPDGRLLLSAHNGPQPIVLRMMPNGDLDPSFGNDGTAALAVPEFTEFTSLKTGVDGKILLVGGYDVGALRQAAAVQLLADGAPDPAFGTNGVVTFFTPDFSDAFTDAILFADGSAIAAGYIIDTGAGAGRFMLRRFDGTGVLDPSFGTGGLVVTDVTTNWDMAHAMALQSDGRLLLAGQSVVGSTVRRVSVARYLLDIVLGSHGPVMDEQARCTWTTEGLMIALPPQAEAGTFVLLDAHGSRLCQRAWNNSARCIIPLPSSLAAGYYCGQFYGPQDRRICRFVVP